MIVNSVTTTDTKISNFYGKTSAPTPAPTLMPEISGDLNVRDYIEHYGYPPVEGDKIGRTAKDRCIVHVEKHVQCTVDLSGRVPTQ